MEGEVSKLERVVERSGTCDFFTFFLYSIF